MDRKNLLLHEILANDHDYLYIMASKTVVICGVGAIGSHLANHLVRQGISKMRVIDDDRVEEHNVGTQIYGINDIGAFKTKALQARIFLDMEIDIWSETRRLNESNIKKFLKGSDVVVDCFDNSVSREVITRYCEFYEKACIHCGMGEGYGQVHWNSGYIIPKDTQAPDVCEYPLSLDLIKMTVLMANTAIKEYFLYDVQSNYECTIKDFKVRKYAKINSE